jgi:flagellar biogenesis protein FliO
VTADDKAGEITNEIEVPSSALGLPIKAKTPIESIRSNLRYIVGFFAVFLGFAGLLIVGRKFSRKLFKRVSRSDEAEAEKLIRTLESVSIGKMQNLTLVEIAGEKVLLSTTPTGVQFLTKIGTGKEMSFNSNGALPQLEERVRFRDQAPPRKLETSVPKQISGIAQEKQGAVLTERTIQGAQTERVVAKGVGFQKYLENSDQEDVAKSSEPEKNVSRSAAEAKLQSIIRNKLKSIPKI